MQVSLGPELHTASCRVSSTFASKTGFTAFGSEFEPVACPPSVPEGNAPDWGRFHCDKSKRPPGPKKPNPPGRFPVPDASLVVPPPKNQFLDSGGAQVSGYVVRRGNSKGSHHMYHTGV